MYIDAIVHGKIKVRKTRIPRDLAYILKDISRYRRR
jgi:hypothetical protein